MSPEAEVSQRYEPQREHVEEHVGQGRNRRRCACGGGDVLLSSVTAPLRASARPVTRVPVVTVMLVDARIFPANHAVVPAVAEMVRRPLRRLSEDLRRDRGSDDRALRLAEALGRAQVLSRDVTSFFIECTMTSAS